MRWVVGCRTCLIALFVPLCVRFVACSMEDDAANAVTVTNLRAAYAAEITAQAQFGLFAATAAREGYARLARLFRAAARAGGIRAEIHAEAMRELDATPGAVPVAPEAHDTAQNLRAAIAATRAMCDSLYPALLGQARTVGNADAARSANFSSMAQRSNLALFEQVASNLAEWKAGGPEIRVCTVCGWISIDEEFEKCPVCFAPKAQVEVVP